MVVRAGVTVLPVDDDDWAVTRPTRYATARMRLISPVNEETQMAGRGVQSYEFHIIQRTSSR